MRRQLDRPSRDGFALLAVLWVIVGATALATAASLAAREAVGSAANRIDLTRAAWVAEACSARGRGAISAVLLDENLDMNERGARWWKLDRMVAASAHLQPVRCDVSLRPVGDAVDINNAPAEQIIRFFRAAGFTPVAADSLTDAVLDWRDPDDLLREFGAERPWYELEGRLLPRNAPIQSLREAAWIRGFDGVESIEGMFSVEPGRICLQHAPQPVLASLPGFTAEAVARITEAQRAGTGVVSLASIADRLSARARDSLVVRLGTLHVLTTTEPDAWLLTSRARVGRPPVTAVIELKLVRAGSRAAIVRRRTWIE